MPVAGVQQPLGSISVVSVKEGGNAATGGDRCCTLVFRSQRVYSRTRKSPTFTDMPARDGTLIGDLHLSGSRTAVRGLPIARTARARWRFLVEGSGHGAQDRPGR